MLYCITNSICAAKREVSLWLLLSTPIDTSNTEPAVEHPSFITVNKQTSIIDITEVFLSFSFCHFTSQYLVKYSFENVVKYGGLEGGIVLHLSIQTDQLKVSLGKPQPTGSGYPHCPSSHHNHTLFGESVELVQPVQ